MNNFFSLDDNQLDAIDRLQNGNILCGGVGSGKSRTAIAYYFKEMGGNLYSEKYSGMKNPIPLYIITTARKRDTKEWEKELIPFLITENVVIESWNNVKKFKEVEGAFFIFDEQRVVGAGEWVKSFLKIAQNNKWILLTATPGDSWSDYIPVFIANGFYKNRTEFLRRHAIYSRYVKYRIERYVGEGLLLKYKNSILVNMNYSHKAEHENNQVKVLYDKAKYKTITKERWDIYENKPIENPASLGYLTRKVVNSDPSRIEAVEKITLSHHKVIIFYSYDYELDILKNGNYPDGTVIAEWNGHKHELIPKTDRWVYLVNYSAGSEGWNCIETDTMIFYSLNYSYRTMVQAKGRIDRRNTPFDILYYYHLVSDSQIDLAISRSLKKKKDFNESKYFRDMF